MRLDVTLLHAAVQGGGAHITAAQAQRLRSLLMSARARTDAAHSAIKHLCLLLHDFVDASAFQSSHA